VLAIELAAARTRALSVADIEQRLTERFRLLRGSSRGRVERHQTLWNTVAWSHQLLEETERLVFDRLSVFAGGFTLEAATSVCATEAAEEFDVQGAVFGLVERSMVVAEVGGDGTRYRLLETLRQFGETQLLDDDTIDLFRGRHARWYGEFARTAGEGSKGADGIVWSRRLRAEFDNYRAVIYGNDIVSARRTLSNLEI
jgi:predicted ATPase